LNLTGISQFLWLLVTLILKLPTGPNKSALETNHHFTMVVVDYVAVSSALW